MGAPLTVGYFYCISIFWVRLVLVLLMEEILHEAHNLYIINGYAVHIQLP